ncbi:MAG: PAS domain S-box protein [Chromatiaceae bacterium]|nr:PAS domain S-box protein [Chromatiaceae bacterium]MCP5434058.1 PAS domain S-box protein [Chromatiaceae bacterium]MCW5584629.1 PAS domain S-box protein [Chromatiales bacterium]
MSLADGALQEKSRPLLSSNLWVPLLLIAAACIAVVYYGNQVAETLKQSAAANARTSGRATAHEIAGFIDREHERLRAFVDEKEAEIRRIVGSTDDWAAIDSLQASLKRLFRGAFAFTVTNADGEPLFEDFDGLVGPVCQSAMNTYAQSIEFGRAGVEIPPIHPVPGAYHFDLITRWNLSDGEAGLFFVSMSPSRIAELIAAAEEVSGMRILLVNRDDPGLIEVTAAGARDVLKEHFRLSSDALVPGHFMADLPGTHWKLLVLPDTAALSAAVSAVHLNVAALVLALLLISAALLFVIRRAEQRNSSLFMRSLQSSVSRQRAILQSMVDGMVTIDEKGTVLHVNNAVTRLFGYTSSELLGSNVRVLMPEPHRAAHDGYLRNYLNTGESKILGKGREVMGRRKDGTVFPVLLTLGESIEGEQRIFVGILHDMTAYNDAQRQIVAQSMAIKRTRQELDEIGQIAAKNLQMPLQRIASLGELLASERMNVLSRHEKAQLKTLTAEARDMSELARGIADYTRTEGQPVAQTVDLDNILVDVKKGLAAMIAESGAQVSVDEGLGVVTGNAKQLRQVFWNLLENALKFRDPQRRPLIRVALAPPDAASDAVDDERVSVLVSDNGIGIPADKLEAVFEAFCRLHSRETYPGMGLGLSFCRKIVEGLGGQISAESAPGEGSTFHVVLPRPRPA